MRILMSCTSLQTMSDQAHVYRAVAFAAEGKPSPFRSAAEARPSLPSSQQQSLDLVKDVKQSVAELRLLVKDAVSHREKCCTVLSSALAVSLALEQVSNSHATAFIPLYEHLSCEQSAMQAKMVP